MTPFETMPFLIVEDGAAMRRSVREIMRSLGVRYIVEAADGAEALQQCRLLPPDVIVLDWVLPDFTGGEFLRLLRTAPDSPAPEADVIVMTAQPNARILAEASRWGVHSIMRKPFTERMMKERLDLLAASPRVPGAAAPGLLTLQPTG